MNNYFILINRDVTNVYRYDGEIFSCIGIGDHKDIPNIVYTSLSSNSIEIDFESKLFEPGRYQLFSFGSYSCGMELHFALKIYGFLDQILGSIEQFDSTEKNYYIILGFLPNQELGMFDLPNYIKYLFEVYKERHHYNIKNGYFMYKYYLVLGISSYLSQASKSSFYYFDNDMIVESTVNKKGKNDMDGFYPWNNKEMMGNTLFLEYLRKNGIELHDELTSNIINFTRFIDKESNDEIVLNICDEEIKVSCEAIIEEKDKYYDEAMKNLNDKIKTIDDNCLIFIDFTDDLIVKKFNNLDSIKTKDISKFINIELIFKYAVIVADNSNRVNIMKAKKNPKLADLVKLDIIYNLNLFFFETNRKKNDIVLKELGIK